MSEVAFVLAQATRAFPPFELSLGSFGAFPSLARPQVVWAGVGGGAAELRALMQAVERACAGIGFAGEERETIPHLTLARLARKAPATSLVSALGAERLPADVASAVREVVLYRSELLAGGPRYTRMAAFPLGDT